MRGGHCDGDHTGFQLSPPPYKRRCRVFLIPSFGCAAASTRFPAELYPHVWRAAYPQICFDMQLSKEGCVTGCVGLPAEPYLPMWERYVFILETGVRNRVYGALSCTNLLSAGDYGHSYGFFRLGLCSKKDGGSVASFDKKKAAHTARPSGGRMSPLSPQKTFYARPPRRGRHPLRPSIPIP